MRKKWIAAAVTAAALLGLWGCDSTPKAKVYVQNVGEITGAGAIAVNDVFPGIVVSEKVTEIQRDTERTVTKLHVAEGDNVKQGDVLFQYDSEELQLSLDKQNLELEQLKNTSTTLQSQIAALQKEQKNASKDEQLSYTVEIQSKEAQKKENDYNIKVKQREIAQTKTNLANAEILAPVSGRVVSVSEDGYDQYGNPKPYITIQQSGSYRVKGTINELSMGAVTEGMAMRIFSRTDPEQTWSGTVSLIDLESATQSNPNSMYFGSMEAGEMGATSKYPFYVELSSADGLMLGQHVYMELASGETATGGLWLPEYYLCYEEPAGEDQEKGDPYVWAANDMDRLEKRYVTLGGYDEMQMAYEVLEGLTVEDEIAYPSETCVAGAVVTRDPAEATEASGETSEGDPMMEPDGSGENGEQGESGVDMTPADPSGQEGLPIEEGVEGADVLAPTGDQPEETTGGGNPATPSPTTGTGTSGTLNPDEPTEGTASDGDLEG